MDEWWVDTGTTYLIYRGGGGELRDLKVALGPLHEVSFAFLASNRRTGMLTVRTSVRL